MKIIRQTMEMYWNAVPGLESAVLSQKSQSFKTVPKKPKKPKFGDLGLLQGLEVSKLWVFGFFGTVRHFCSFGPGNIGFFWTVQRSCSFGPKTLVQ